MAQLVFLHGPGAGACADVYNFKFADIKFQCPLVAVVSTDRRNTLS
jgi:hypothetical protein